MSFRRKPESSFSTILDSGSVSGMTGDEMQDFRTDII
jgi:hypothetical protein